jgi:iron complex outermembrane recepter protein
VKKTVFARVSLFAIAISAGLAGPAFAQESSGEATDAGDIIVTATRESTLLSKTPIAITAITNEGLRDAGITDSRSLNDLVPNLRITENGDAVRISIRGVTSSDTTEKGDPSAAFLLDGIYIARAADTLGSFYDLERVEVLRGPQGTLYGRNTTAGVINVIAARPSDKFEASADGRYGNLNSIGATGMINVPIGAGIGVRAAVNYERQDANLIKGVTSTIPLNPFRNVLAGRLSIGGSLGDNFTFVVRGDYSQSKGALSNAVPLSTFFPNVPSPGATTANAAAPFAPITIIPAADPVYVGSSSRNQRTLPYAEQYPNRRNNNVWGVMGEFTYDFGPVALTYLGSHRETERDDVRNLRLFGVLNNPAFFFGNFKQDSHELRVAFGKGSALHGQVGGYYFKEKSFIEFNLGNPLSGIVAGGSGPPNFNAIGFAFPQGPTIAESKAAFGQLTYDLTDDLHLTGGIRYTNDLKSRNGATVLDFNTVANSFCGALRCILNENIARKKFNKTTWKVGVDYDAPGLGLIYANVSTGYKAGGFNDGCITGAGLGCTLTATQLFYNPETLTAYEGGFKFKLMDNALRLNLSAFHYDYKSLQLSTIVFTPGAPPATLTSNAGSAKVDGVEFEALISPSDNDKVEFSINYTDARYDKFVPGVFVNVIGPGGTPVTDATGANVQQLVSRDFKGLQLDHAPKYSASAGYTHTFPLGNGGKVDAAVRTRLSGAYFMQDLNQLSQYRQPSFTKTDLTLTYNAPEDRFYIQGFVKNLENEITLAAASSGLGASATIEEPRTYGVRAGFKF